MATYTLVKFKNMTPLHMGTGKENYDFSATVLQSDTLSSALAAIRVQMDANTDVETFLDSFVVSFLHSLMRVIVISCLNRKDVWIYLL